MELIRRNLLVAGLACLPLGVTAAYSLLRYPTHTSSIIPQYLLLSSVTDKQGLHYLAALNEAGEIHYQLPIPERAHDSLFNSRRSEAIYFGRSPSQSIYVVNVIDKRLTTVIASAQNRCFYGHGIIDKTNSYLYVVEKNMRTNNGCVGVYDVNDRYKRIDEIDSFGVGPHQISLLSDNKTLVVANGGLLKDSNKNIINYDDFRSSLAYINSDNGALIDRYASEFSRNSLRHLTVDIEDRVFVGAQSYSDEVSPLIFYHGGEDQLTPFVTEEYIWQAHKKYTASLAVYNNQLIVSSPRGGVLTFWDTKEKRFLSKHNYIDVAGLSMQSTNDASSLFVSTGQGRVVSINMGTESVSKSASHSYYSENIAWDNHLSLAALSS
jgi:hypothetical protein